MSTKIWVQGTGGQVTNRVAGTDSPGVGWRLAQGTEATQPLTIASEVYTRRRHIFERATSVESAALTAAMENYDDQLTQIFLASDWIDHANPLFPMLQAALNLAIGEARTAILLAPSVYPEV